MSIGDILGGRNRTSTTTQTSTYTPVQSQQIGNFLPSAEEFYQQGTPDVSGIQTGQQNAMQAYLDAAGGLGGNAQALQGAQQSLFNAANPAANPAFQQYLQFINDETLRATQQLLPRLATEGVMSGTLGASKYDQAKQQIGESAQRQIAGNTAGAINQAYGQGLNAVAQGIGLNPNVIGAFTAPADLTARASDINATSTLLPYNLQTQHMNNYADILARNFGGTTTGTTTQPRQTGGLAGALGGASAGAGLAQIPGAQAYAPWLIGGGAALGLLS